jgi:hypothetical protein
MLNNCVFGTYRAPPATKTRFFFLTLGTLLFEQYYVLSSYPSYWGSIGGLESYCCPDQLPLFAQIYSYRIVARPLGIAHNDD